MAVRTVTPQPAELARSAPTFADSQRERVALRQAVKGKLNCAGDVTLVTGAGVTTDIDDSLITAQTFVSLSPLDIWAAAEIGAGNLFVTYPSPGRARINHTASTQTRSFRYVLIGMLLLLFGVSASAQQIQDDGTPLEVRPALNFTSNIACANDADSTNCSATGGGGGNDFSTIGNAVSDVAGDTLTVTDSSTIDFTTTNNPEDLTAVVGADVMLESVWSTGATYGLFAPYVDFAEVAQGAVWLDYNLDGVPELTCTEIGGVTFSCEFDINGDGTDDFVIFPGSIEYGFPFLATRLAVGTSGAASTCLSRDTTANVDRLFEDKDCDSVVPPEATPLPLAITNSEAFLIDWQRRMTATFGPVVAVAGAGVQVTTLKIDLDYIGSYWIEYQLLTQSTAVGTGMSFGVEYTGAETSLYCRREFVSTGVTCPAVPACLLLPCAAIPACGATGVTDDVAATLTGQLVEGYASNVASTVTPLLGPNDGVAVADSTALETIRCNLRTTTAGDLQLWMTSETGVGVNLMANSLVKATAFP